MNRKKCIWEKRYFFGPTYTTQCKDEKYWTLYNEHYKFCPLCGNSLVIDTTDYDLYVEQKEKIDKDKRINPQRGERGGTPTAWPHG